LHYILRQTSLNQTKTWRHRRARQRPDENIVSDRTKTGEIGYYITLVGDSSTSALLTPVSIVVVSTTATGAASPLGGRSAKDRIPSNSADPDPFVAVGFGANLAVRRYQHELLLCGGERKCASNSRASAVRRFRPFRRTGMLLPATLNPHDG